MIRFIGLGTMGFHMAGHLHKAFPDQLVVWNRSIEKSKHWQSIHNGSVIETFSEMGSGARIVMLCVGRDEDVESICLGEQGLINQLETGSIIVDHTTTSAILAKRMQTALSAKGIAFLDAPVSGGEAGAVNGALSTMIGGDETAVATVRPYLDTYSKQVIHMGSCGSGQLTKMANQICIGGLLQSLSEAIKFAETASLDVTKLLSAISGGASQSWQMENRGHTMHQRAFDFGFAVDWMIKDLGYCVSQAQENGLELSITEQMLMRYQTLSDQGHGQKDTSALILGLDS